MSASCLIATDLASVRLVADGVDDVWTAPPADDPDQPPALRTLAASAAEWIVERLRGRRLDAACLDIDEARCLWIAAPTREAAVITAAVRQRRAEWGDDDASGDMVQPLVEPRPAGRSAPKEKNAETFAAVLETPDAGVKLLFDALDARGVRVGESLSLWHALARRADDEMTCVLSCDRPGRLIWVWGEGGGLLAAGLCRVATGEDAGDPAVGRLALDWLTWTAQLGRMPERFVIVGDGAGAADAIAERWPDATVETVSSDDPLRDLLLGAAEGAPSEGDPRRSTPSLNRRPSRSHRRVYRLAAFAVLLLAVGVAGLGLRALKASASYTDIRGTLRVDAQDLVRGMAPGNETNPDLVAALDSYFAQLKVDQPLLQPPPPPRPIFDELVRLLDAAAPIDGVTVNRISIEDRAGSVQFRISTYEDGEKLLEALDKANPSGQPHPLDWSERFTGSPPNLVMRLQGIWL